MQGVQRLSAREVAPLLQGVRRCSIGSTVTSALSARSAVVHNLRARSSALYCKECGSASICEHGRRRSDYKECGGSQICEHGRGALSARSVVVHQSASTVVYALGARSVVVHRVSRARSSALSVQGMRWVSGSASTVSQRSRCKECGGGGICEHGRMLSVQGSVVVHHSASTVVGALSARTLSR